MIINGNRRYYNNFGRDLDNLIDSDNLYNLLRDTDNLHDIYYFTNMFFLRAVLKNTIKISNFNSVS